MKWFEERLYEDSTGGSYAQRFKIDRILCDEVTKFQQIMIFETPFFGRVLALDGIIQTTERDEFSYHEMLAHVPIMDHGNVKKVLIIGGGDGGVLKEVLKHKKIERVTLVEIDARVIELCKLYLPSVNSGAFESARVDILIENGFDFVSTNSNLFDLIIVDSTDPSPSSKLLFSRKFFESCQACLAPKGIFVNQNGVPFLQSYQFKNTSDIIQHIFVYPRFYFVAVPTYVGGHMALGHFSDSNYSNGDIDKIIRRFQQTELDTCYYNPDIHQSAFSAPNFISNLAYK